MPGRASWLAAGVICLLATILLAEQGIVRTHDGNTYDGFIREDEREVVVTIRGIETVIPRGNIASIEYKGEYEEDFRDRLASLPENEVPGRVAMAREAFEQHRYDLSRVALDEAMRADPNSRDAYDMLVLVERQIRLERAGPAQPTDQPAERAPPEAARPGPPQRPGMIERRTLSPDDINTIRQKELKLTDTAVRIAFQGDVRRQFAQLQNMTFAEFRRFPPVQQAIQIIDRGDIQMRRQVRITSDPSAIIEYKRFVQPLILSNCATSGCHGGPAGGRFIVYSPADQDAVAYTNFYILTQFAGRTEPRTSQGIFGAEARRMIERGHGENSLLANYGLPIAIAEHDHPLVGGKPIQPVFRNRQDPRYLQIVNWMNNVLVRIEPDYDIDFELPTAAPAAAAPPALADEPATQPAALEEG
jgi:hypothetical protein